MKCYFKGKFQRNSLLCVICFLLLSYCNTWFLKTTVSDTPPNGFLEPLPDCSKFVQKKYPELATFATFISPDYWEEALTLIQSFRDQCSTAPWIVTSLSSIDEKIITNFEKFGAKFIQIPHFPRPPNLLVQEVSWNVSFDKLGVFNLTYYKKIVFVDADIMAIRNMDELLVAPAFSWTTGQCYGCGASGPVNGGLFVLRPDTTVFERIIKMIQEISKTAPEGLAGSDQSVIHYFMERDTFDYHTLLSGYYNIHPDSCDCLPNFAAKYVKAIHFACAIKPWTLQPDTKLKDCVQKLYQRWFDTREKVRKIKQG